MKKQMNEARGVPENIDNFSKIVLDKVLENLRNNRFQNAHNKLILIVNTPTKFLKDNQSVVIDKIEFNINFDFHSSSDIKKIANLNSELKTKTDELLLTGLAMEFKAYDDLTKKGNLKIVKSTIPILHINFLASTSIYYVEDDVYKLIKDNYDEILSLFGHEIMHYVSGEVKGEEDLALMAKYLVVSKRDNVTDIEPLNDFIFNLYYLISTENIVRPTEFKTFLTSKRATKKQFLQSYYDSNMFKKFNMCENETYEKLYNKIDEELAKNQPKNIYNINTKDTEIHKRLREAIVNLINQGGSLLKKIVADKMPNSSLDEQDVVYSKKLSIFLKKHMFIKQSSNKIIDVEKTYRAIIKDMNNTATKMKKKIAKIYEDIPF